MSTPSNQLDAIIATTLEAIKPQLADNITQDTALLAALNTRSKVTQDGGRDIVRPLMYALNSTVASYDGYDLIDTTPQSGLGEAIYNWRQVAGSVTISGKEERMNRGREQLINLLTAKVDQLRLSLEKSLNTMLWSDGTGNSGKDILGLQAIINDSGTLGGIDSSTETWWKAVTKGAVSGAVGADLTSASGVVALNNVFNTLSLNRSKPTFEFTTQANYEAYEGLAEPNIRFTSVKMADLGFEAIAHKTAEVVFEAAVPAPSGSGGGFWYFINTDFLEFVQNSGAWLMALPFQQPYNQDAKTSLNISMGNLVTNMRRAHGVIKNVAV